MGDLVVGRGSHAIVVGHPTRKDLVKKCYLEKDELSVSFVREVSALSTLGASEHFVCMMRFDAFAQEIYLFRCDHSVEERIHTLGLPAPQLRHLWRRQLMAAVRHLHEKCLIHRDIKPSNLLLSGEMLRLADFGSCTRWIPGRAYTLNVGTTVYASPEMFHQPFYDHGVDLWSVGMTLEYLRAGKLPFEFRRNHSIQERATMIAMWKSTALVDSEEAEAVHSLVKEVASDRMGHREISSKRDAQGMNWSTHSRLNASMRSIVHEWMSNVSFTVGDQVSDTLSLRRECDAAKRMLDFFIVHPRSSEDINPDTLLLHASACLNLSYLCLASVRVTPVQWECLTCGKCAGEDVDRRTRLLLCIQPELKF